MGKSKNTCSARLSVRVAFSTEVSSLMGSFDRTTKEVLAHIGQYPEYLPSQLTVSLSDRRQGGGFALTVGWMRPHSLTVCMLSHPTPASHATQGAVLLRFGFIGLIVRRAYRPKLKG